MTKIRPSAIAIGFFVGFVVPAAIYFAIGSALFIAREGEVLKWIPWFNSLWFAVAIGMPLLAGYLTARVAQVQPLLHGGIVGMLGSIGLVVLAIPISAALYSAIIFVPGGVAGAWLWKKFRRTEGAL